MEISPNAKKAWHKFVSIGGLGRACDNYEEIRTARVKLKEIAPDLDVEAMNRWITEQVTQFPTTNVQGCLSEVWGCCISQQPMPWTNNN